MDHADHVEEAIEACQELKPRASSHKHLQTREATPTALDGLTDGQACRFSPCTNLLKLACRLFAYLNLNLILSWTRPPERVLRNPICLGPYSHRTLLLYGSSEALRVESEAVLL